MWKRKLYPAILTWATAVVAINGQESLSSSSLANDDYPDIPGPFFADQSDRKVALPPDQQDTMYLFAHEFRSSNPAKLAIVSTVYQVNDMLADWIRYYLEVIEFDVAIVFIDHLVPEDGTTVTEAKLRQQWGNKLLLVRRGAALEHELETIVKLYNRFGGFYPFEVQARQLLHLGFVADRTKELGIDWVLHLDLDELWVLPTNENVHSHFEKLNQDGITQAVYSNIESIPLHDDLPKNETAFHAMTLFLRSELSLSQQAQFKETQAVRAQRQSATDKSLYLQGYWVGKIASRISTGTIFPWDVCRNALPPEVWGNTKIAAYDDLSGPIILHYISTGPEAWISKYSHLASFSDKSFDPDRVDPAFFEQRPPGVQAEFPAATTQLPFARISRDKLAAANSHVSVEEAMEWYRSVIGLSPHMKHALRKAGVLVKVTEVAQEVSTWIDVSPPSGQSSKGFPAIFSAPTTTCEGFPHFQCHVRGKNCCTFLSSPAFMFMQHQLGYRGKRMDQRKEWLKEQEELAKRRRQDGSDEL